MELKLKKNFEEAYVWVSFVNANVMGKFIDKGLYPHLYKVNPEMFDVIPVKGLKQKIEEIKKEEKINDISINISTDEDNITE